MVQTKISSKDIFERIHDIEADMGEVQGKDLEILTEEKERLLPVYASLRIAEALESMAGEKNPSPEIFSEKKEQGRTLAEIFAAEEEKKSKESFPEKIFPEKEKLDLDKINKIAHLLVDRFRLTFEKKKTEEDEKKLETVNSYLETYGFELKHGILTNRNHSGEATATEILLAYKFAIYLYRQGDPSTFELERLKRFNLVPRKEKNAAGEEVENLQYISSSESDGT